MTELCQNYGLIDHCVYFTSGEVLGGVSLHVGDEVNALAVKDGAHGGWRALRVGAMYFTILLKCLFLNQNKKPRQNDTEHVVYQLLFF